MTARSEAEARAAYDRYELARKACGDACCRADALYASRWRRWLFGPPTHNGRSTRAQQLGNVRPDYHRAFAAEDRARTAMVAACRAWVGEEAGT